MEETTNTMTKYLVGGLFSAELCGVVFDLRWWLGFLFCLVLSDFWFGRSESRKRGNPFHWSRCIRRSMNKICDYSTYMVVGFVAGGAILEPLGWGTPASGGLIGIIAACVAEVFSVSGHILFLHGVKFSFKKFIIALVKFRWNELGTALEKATEEIKVESQNQDENGKS